MALLPSDILVDAGNSEFSSAGLRVSSLIRVHRIVSIRTKSIMRTLGILGPNLQHEVTLRIKLLFGV
jgi:hypothetical protein